ncbi:MAG: hypothetical protein WC455_01015 [Dehalococcoidia bacterium]|jgi:hypothetical protein
MMEKKTSNNSQPSKDAAEEQPQEPYAFKTSEEVQFLKEVVDRSLPPNTRHLTTIAYKNLTIFVVSTDSKMVMVDDGFLPLGVVILNVGKPKGLLLTREEYEVPYEFSGSEVYEKYGISDNYRMSELNGLRLIGVGKPYRGPMMTGHGDANSVIHSIEGVPVSELINYLVGMIAKRYGLVLRKILATSCNSRVGALGEVSIPVFYAMEDVRPFSNLDRRTSQRGRGPVDLFVTWGDRWMAKYPGKEPVVYRPKAEDIAAHPPLTREEIKLLIQKDAEDRERAEAEEAAKTFEDESPKVDRSRIIADYLALVKASFVSLGQRVSKRSQETDSSVYTTYAVPESVEDRESVESTIYGIDGDIEGAIAAFYEGDLTEEEFNTYMLEKANELKEKWFPAIESAKNNVKSRQDAIKILDSLLASMPETHTIMPFRSLLEGWRRELKTI